MRRTVTAESVTSGHPDKVCDQISDHILDEVLRQDPDARVACEVAINNRLLLIMGEITTQAKVDYTAVALEVLRDIGYMESDGLSDIQVIVSLNEQAGDIAMGVNEYGSFDEHSGLGAGDQGLMIGYACNETPELMPLPIILAHGLTRELGKVRKCGRLNYLKPDGKAQVTVAYENGIANYVDTIVLSTQHRADIERKQLLEDIEFEVIRKVIPDELMRKETKILINPTGRFVIGGPKGDSGLTGRKIIVDTYGGIARHGGGAFSGKDPSKVDRSGAYMARYLAKNIVAAGLADKCEIELAFAIGRPNPISLMINTFGTGRIPDNEIESMILDLVDLSVSSIIEILDLKRPIYSKTATYGHFGKQDMPWEQTDLSDRLRSRYRKLQMNSEQTKKDALDNGRTFNRDEELKRMKTRYENLDLPACPFCQSKDTSAVIVGIVGMSLELSRRCKKVHLRANGRPGQYYCNECKEYFD